ncbi:WAT1-related protein [Vigna unguiculata]|uniref:WAT1-related protein n=1 Tax=Vigna unguiculata TaxID=3917 RepID=A0A4D6L2H7_VIGUN|nr:WAT1-related protein [Vigna unguiculata]
MKLSGRRMWCSVPERVQLHAAMLALQFGDAGFHVVSRAALNMGISKLVFPVYRNTGFPFFFFKTKVVRPPAGFCIYPDEVVRQEPPLPPECGAPSRNGFSCMRPCWPCSLATPDSTSSQELPLTWALANLFSQSTATLLPYSCSFLLPTSWKIVRPPAGFCIYPDEVVRQEPPLPPECGAPSRNGFSCMRPCWPCSLATPDSTSSQELPLTWALANLFSQSTATLLPYSCSFLLPTSWKRPTWPHAAEPVPGRSTTFWRKRRLSQNQPLKK